MFEDNQPKIFRLFLYLLIPITVFISLNEHATSELESYHGVLWADASGYYVYLPIWFIHGNNAKNFPQDIEERAGRGFELNYANNRVTSKYTSGVAILEAPFFLAGHIISMATFQKSDGFAPIYHRFIMVAGAVYACLGLFFLACFLSYFFNPTVSFLSSLLLFTSTNLFFYATHSTGMSHIYSFFIYSAILYLFPKIFSSTQKLTFLLFGFLVGLAVLIRPTNIIFLAFLPLIQYPQLPGLAERIKLLFKNWSLLAISVIAAGMVFIPQFIYWKQISGSFLHYSYGGEGFTNWKNPEILKVWFSSNNGLFPYALSLTLFVIGLVWMMIKKQANGFLIALLFLIISYVFSSWWCWWYGCSFGSRSFVEYYPLLVFPIAWLLSRLKNKYHYIPVAMFLLICSFINIKMAVKFDYCFFGGTWDFEPYFNYFLN